MDGRGKDSYPHSGEYAIDRTYAQDHKPVVNQDEAVGHCVRAMFLYIPLTDLAALTRGREYQETADKIWEDVVQHKLYLTGSIGSIRFHEQFGSTMSFPISVPGTRLAPPTEMLCGINACSSCIRTPSTSMC